MDTGCSHRTEKSGHHLYRPCLQWDFGFICSLCLLHEADLALQGIARLGITTVEHLELQSTHASLVNDYTNLIYACKWCNRARGIHPRSIAGVRLLDPTQDAWANYFKIEGDNLVPINLNHQDAVYTFETYDINEDRKVARREFRRNFISPRIDIIQNGLKSLQDLMSWAEQHPNDSLMLISKAQSLRETMLQIILELKIYAAIPADAPQQCRCGTTAMHCLPDEFLKQVIHIENY